MCSRLPLQASAQALCATIRVNYFFFGAPLPTLVRYLAPFVRSSVFIPRFLKLFLASFPKLDNFGAILFTPYAAIPAVCSSSRFKTLSILSTYSIYRMSSSVKTYVRPDHELVTTIYLPLNCMSSSVVGIVS